MDKTVAFVAKARGVHGNRYDYSRSVYISATTHLIVVCPAHGEYLVSPHSHLKGSRCRKCATDAMRTPRPPRKRPTAAERRDRFIAAATAVHNGRYGYMDVDYVDSQTKVAINCPDHGQFLVKPGNHLHRRSGCPRCCAYRGLGLNRFLEKAKHLFPSLLFDRVAYHNNRTEIVVGCPAHGEFTTTPRSILAGHGCGKCNTTALSRAEFLARAGALFPGYDFGQATYKNNQTKVVVGCPAHGQFMAAPASLLAGHGCAKCYTDGKVFSTADFARKGVVVHGGQYDYVGSEYHRSTDKVLIGCTRCGRDFAQLPGNHLQGAGCPFCGGSAAQASLHDLLAAFGTNIEYNNRTVLKPYEIDCYLPGPRLGIEYHGLYWHSEGTGSRNLGYKKDTCQKKALAAHANGIKLLQFWEHEWKGRPGLMRAMVEHRLGLATVKAHARTLPIKEIADHEAALFYNRNHLQGHRTATVNLALGDMMVMSFSPIPGGWEIIRMASELQTVVRGGAHRLFNHFLRQYKPESMTTFADLRYSTGQVYHKLGFTQIAITNPGYFYYKGNTILSRYQCQKRKLVSLLGRFDPSLSEPANMFNNGYRRVWDAGHLKFKQLF